MSICYLFHNPIEAYVCVCNLFVHLEYTVRIRDVSESVEERPGFFHSFAQQGSLFHRLGWSITYSTQFKTLLVRNKTAKTPTHFHTESTVSSTRLNTGARLKQGDCLLRSVTTYCLECSLPYHSSLVSTLPSLLERHLVFKLRRAQQQPSIRRTHARHTPAGTV